MSYAENPPAHPPGDGLAPEAPFQAIDRRDLAFIAVERTRMPMVVTDPRRPDNPIVLANKAFLDFTGYSEQEIVGYNCRFLQGPETDPAAVSQIREAVAHGRELTIDLVNYRKDGSRFWNQLFISPVHDDAGKLLYFFASQTDVTHPRDARQLELEEHRLMLEVDHRAKNALALVQGIVRLSRADDAAAYSQAVQGRVDALARAHSLLAERSWRQVPLERLIQGEVEPFGVGRIDMAGPLAEVAAAQVQPLALLLHEMLANAAQHGALSMPEGRVSLQWHANGEIHLDWRETNGPAPADVRRPGFGSSMMAAIVRRQLNGHMTFDWAADGLRSNLTFPHLDPIPA